MLEMQTGGQITNTGNDYTLDENGVTLGDNTQITLGTNGKITNVGNDYTIDEDGVILGDNTEIIMGNNSVIRNENDDYTLDADGLNLNPTDSFKGKTSVTWGDDFGIGGYVLGNLERIQYKADIHDFTDDIGRVGLQIQPGYQGGTVTVPSDLKVGNFLRLPRYTTSDRPSARNLDDGTLIYNEDEGKLNYVENGAWTAP